MTRTFEILRPDRLHDAVTLLRDAPRVWFIGFGAEEGLARYGRTLLARLRHDVMQLAYIKVRGRRI